MPDIDQTRKNRKYRALLCICLLIYVAAMLVRVGKMLLDPVLERDAGLYLVWVENWIATGQYHYTFFDQVGPVPPLTLWFIKMVMQTGIDAETAGRAVSLFFGSLMPVVGFIFTLRICRNIRIALLAAILLVFHPDLVQYSGQPLRENPYVFFDGLLLLLIVESIRKSTALKWAGCGILLSLTAYCRFEALEFTVIVPFILAALCSFRKMNVKDAVRNSATFYLSFCLTYILLLTCVDFDYEFITRPLSHIAQFF